jgi:methylmalonyl-CoA mutase N-terminal domain/subunit
MNLACFDEVYAIPSDLAIRTSLRIQQVLAYETGVADVVDPLGGSYYVESLTNEMEAKMLTILETIERRGGIVQEVESGQVQRELAQQSYTLQKKVNSGERILVGVTRFSVKEEERDLELYKMDPEVRDRQVDRLRRIKGERDGARVIQSLKRLELAARANENIIPYLFEPLRAYATVGEIVTTLKQVYGEFKEPKTV